MSQGKLSYRRPWLYGKQERAFFCDERISCIEASTKAGKTVAAIAWIVERAILDERSSNFWWVAPVIAQADIAWRRLQGSLPRSILKMCDISERKSSITFPNGATIWMKSAERPDQLYGEDVRAAVIDEASRCKEESWHAVRSTLTATRGDLRAIGNVRGRKNWFYKLCRLAESDERDDMAYHKITWEDAVEAGVLDRQEIDDARSVLPESVFRELYEAEAADDGGNPFGIDHIRGCIFRDEQNRPTEQLPETVPVAWGWDVAKAYNWTVGVALDAAGRVCRLERFQSPWELTFQRIMSCTGKRTNAFIDSTPGSGGDPILERLIDNGYKNFEPFKFTPANKQQLMVGLAAAIQGREISFPDGVLVEELENFEYEHASPRHGMDRVFYRAAEGHHDDCVDALAMAVHCLNLYGTSYEPAPAAVAVADNYYSPVRGYTTGPRWRGGVIRGL